MRTHRWELLLTVALSLCGWMASGAEQAIRPEPALPPLAVESQKAEGGVTYGKSGELPLPKTILFSVSPAEILADAEEWKKRGIEAFFMDFIARNWATDIWAADGSPATIGESDGSFQTAKKANEVCKRIGSETFLKIAFDQPFEWFNDIAWQQINHNFRQFAIFARETGCTGIALDIEYIGEQYGFNWSGYTYKGYTRKDLIEKIKDRMTSVINALYDEFPNMVFLTFPEEGLSLGTVIHTAWIEEAARRNAPGGFHYCTEFTYRKPNIRHMFAHAWIYNDTIDRLLSERGRSYWRNKCTIAAGVWPFGFDNQTVYDPGMPYAEFRQAYAASLMMSPRYNWIYSHNCREMMIGRALDKYTGKEDIKAYLRVMADKEIVTTPKYVALAKDLRALTLRDYAKDLGLVLVPRVVGGSDSVRVDMMLPDTPEAEDSHRREFLDIAMRYYSGEQMNFHEMFRTQTHWMLIGPFGGPNTWSGYEVVYPPEKDLNLDAEYDGWSAKVHWIEHQADASSASVNLAKALQSVENACAYALCYVTSLEEREAQIRVGLNDSGKVWLGGKLVYEYPYEGSACLDKGIVPATIPKGTTPILVKICNGKENWTFIFRITDRSGKPLEGIRFSPRPE